MTDARSSVFTSPRASIRSTALVWTYLVGGLVMGVGAGCASHPTLTRTHGHAYAQAFGNQTVNPGPRQQDPKATQGLDSQEATVVARTYRRSLGPRDSGGADTGSSQMLLVNPGAGVPTPYLPPPSVPQGR